MENTVKKYKLKCPVAIYWPISEDRLKGLKDKPGEYLSSVIFTATNIPELQYYISIFPNLGGNDEGKTCIFVSVQYESQVKFNLNISTETANIFKNVEGAPEEESISRGCYYCKTEELFDQEKRFIVNGKMVLKIEGTLMVEKEMPQKEQTFGDHRDALCLGLWNQEVKDFTIVVGEKEITAHKNVLSTRSPVFARMLECGMKEAQENNVIIKDFTFETVEMAIKFCYHHSLVTNTTLEDRMELMKFYDKYDIELLKDDLEKLLISEIDESNVCLLANCSLLSNASNLKEKCSEFLRDCLQKTKPVCDFELLDKDFAMKLLKNSFFQIAE